MALGFSHQPIPWSMGICPRCRNRAADPVLLGRTVEGHVCGECWREDRADDDCEDQGGMATDVCVKWGCDNALLELRGHNWCCSNCGASYGEDARGPHTHITTGREMRQKFILVCEPDHLIQAQRAAQFMVERPDYKDVVLTYDKAIFYVRRNKASITVRQDSA